MLESCSGRSCLRIEEEINFEVFITISQHCIFVQSGVLFLAVIIMFGHK